MQPDRKIGLSAKAESKARIARVIAEVGIMRMALRPVNVAQPAQPVPQRRLEAALVKIMRSGKDDREAVECLGVRTRVAGPLGQLFVDSRIVRGTRNRGCGFNAETILRQCCPRAEAREISLPNMGQKPLLQFTAQVFVQGAEAGSGIRFVTWISVFAINVSHSRNLAVMRGGNIQVVT